MPVQRDRQRPRARADDFSGVPIRHLPENGACTGQVFARLGVAREKFARLKQYLAYVTADAAVPVFLHRDAPHLQQMQLAIASFCKFNIQRRAAIAQAFQLARQLQQLRHARRINVISHIIAMHQNRFIDHAAAGDGIGLASFVIVIQHIIRRAAVQLVRHNYATQSHIRHHRHH